MKRFLTVILALIMVLTMSAPAFADNVSPDAAEPTAPAELTAAQVKAIKPAVKAASCSCTKIKVSWDKIEGVDGYKVYRSAKKSGKYSLVRTAADPDTVSYINTGRTCGKTYYYKIRGYKKIGGKTVYTKYSDIKSACARPSRVKINQVCLPKDEQVKVAWNKVSGATGYQVFRKRTDQSTWKRFKTVSGKAASVIDPLRQKVYVKGNSGAFYYDYADLKYNWEYKVRAYRTVNGKKVYGLFSTSKILVPEWTIENVYDEVWRYIESLEWPLYEAVPTYPEPDENGETIYPKKDGSTYHLKHLVGQYTFDGGYDWYGLYSNSANGETTVPVGATYKPRTEKGTSWTPRWPIFINRYLTKDSVISRLKTQFRESLTVGVGLDPKFWDTDWDCWTGIEEFTFYYKAAGNGYNIWCLE